MGFSLVADSEGCSSCGAWALRCEGFGSCGTGPHWLWPTGSRTWTQWLWRVGLVAPWHVEFSLMRGRTDVPCIGGQILTTVPPRESLENILSHFFTDEETKALSNKNDLYTVSQVVILWSNTRPWIGSEIHTCLSFGETFPFFSCLNENGRFSLVLLIDVL